MNANDKTVAYPIDYLQCFTETNPRDDSNVLLPRIRKLFNDNEKKNSLLNCICDTDVGGTVGTVGTLKAAVESAIFNSESPTPPTCKLNVETCKILPSFNVDDIGETSSVKFAAVCDSSDVAILNLPPDLLTPPSLLLIFLVDNFKKLGARHTAKVEIMSTKDNDSVKISAVSLFGTLKAAFHMKSENVSQLFDTRRIDTMQRSALLPRTPAQIPFQMKAILSHFFSEDLRLKVIFAAAANPQMESISPMCMSTVNLKSVDPPNNVNMSTLSGTVHPVSTVCICRAHSNFRDNPLSKRLPFANHTHAKVKVDVSMCGRRLIKLSSQQEHGQCPLHQENTPKVPLIPDLCCHGTVCRIACLHCTDSGKMDRGMHIRSINLDEANLLKAQTILAHALRFKSTASNDSVAAVEAATLGKRTREDQNDREDRDSFLQAKCKAHSDSLAQKIESVNLTIVSTASKYTKEELDKMDSKVVRILKTTGAFQKWIKSRRQTILALPNPKTGGYSSFADSDKNLSDVYKCFFQRDNV